MEIDIKESSVVSRSTSFWQNFPANSFNDVFPAIPQFRPFHNWSLASFPPVPMSINSGIELPWQWNQENRETEWREGDRERAYKKGGGREEARFNENILAKLSVATVVDRATKSGTASTGKPLIFTFLRHFFVRTKYTLFHF